MRLVIIITGLTTGGAETMLLKVLEHLDKRISPVVISLSSLGDIGPSIRSLGIPVEALGMRPGIPNPLAFLKLIRRLKVLKPDVVHTWMYHADLIGGLAARCAGFSGIGWCIRNSNLDRDKTKLSTRVVAAACALVSPIVPDRILCCSEVARDLHVKRGYPARNITVVPNGFDLGRFQPDPVAWAAIRSELGVAFDTPLVGMIGRFDPQKNHIGFFEAAGLLHKQLPTVRFLLAGQDICEGNSELERAMNDAGVQHVTHLLGLRKDIPRLMAALNVLASSSHAEAFPNVLGEAMASGVPCAVTDVGDSAYIVGATGCVVAACDMVGLASAIGSLLTLSPDHWLAMGQSARNRVTEKFGIKQVVKQYEVFYDELVSIGRTT